MEHCRPSLWFPISSEAEKPYNVQQRTPLVFRSLERKSPRVTRVTFPVVDGRDLRIPLSL